VRNRLAPLSGICWAVSATTLSAPGAKNEDASPNAWLPAPVPAYCPRMFVGSVTSDQKPKHSESAGSGEFVVAIQPLQWVSQAGSAV
jgi:hypothetical protein